MGSRFALKEWAVVVRALAQGHQLLLLRKGGIEEETGEFRLEHREFFCYPTFEHQHCKFLRPEFLREFDRAIAEQPGASQDIVLSTYARVTDCLVARDEAQLAGLESFHIWNEEYLGLRFRYKPEKPLYVLVLRAYRLAPFRVPYRAEYRGCKSWVELDCELPTGESQPALSDEEFARACHQIRRRLEAA